MKITEDMRKKLEFLNSMYLCNYGKEISRIMTSLSVEEFIQEAIDEAIEKIESNPEYDFDSSINNDKEYAIADIHILSEKILVQKMMYGRKNKKGGNK